MMRLGRSLKAQLLAWLLLMVGLIGVLLLLEAYYSTQRAATRAFDRALSDAVLTISEAIQWQDGHPHIMIPSAALQMLATDHQERIFYRVLNAQGQSLAGNLDIPLSNTDMDQAQHHSVWADMDYQHERWRLLGESIQSAGWQEQDPVQIWVGHTTEGRKALAKKLFQSAVGRFLVMVLLVSFMVMTTMNVALAPLKKLRQQLRQRRPDDNYALDINVPKEMDELVETLNNLFARQRDNHDALLRFTADASHQLRTPLAGLQNISELALGQQDPSQWHSALEKINLSAQKTSRLASQLLNLARLRHAQKPEHDTLLDLKTLLQEVTLEWVEREYSYHHDLGLNHLPSEAILIPGDVWAIRELINNLIDNALQYTPPGTQITLGLLPSAQHVELFIEDNGPGVPVSQLPRLHHPFERGGRQDTAGSGLGLAIVDTITRQHQAALQISERAPSGLRVSIRFPRTRSAES
ncbi:histidine kinase [Terasakiispira papahanaumokuakeensis]|uniref:histidine kinase n=1 Tax=Terasakiispira papahanaumokuakeensis TaxID=197479 RepID=A0A1E2V5G0_9GAMM|nr:sensor histidine kinase [Terasakiispira papahanaumokuakeensis]ODC02240.1 histidine kinase [Terasakiispira papahanaumokuakeensis]